MNKSKENIVPELRFPEFNNTEEWDFVRLSELGNTISGLSGKSAEDFGFGKPYVTYKQVFDNSFVDFSICGQVNIKDEEKQNILCKGDILFTTSSETPNEVGFASVIINSPLEDTYLNSFCFSFRPNNLQELIPSFSRYLFHSPFYRKSIGVLAQGSTRYNISKGSFLNLKIALPKAIEQQKIADCLSSLDELITAQNNKIELLKSHKKGLIQNLFPAEGETKPKLRFKEFEKDGDWKYEKLEDYIELFSGIALKSEELSNDESGIPILRGINITEGFIRHSKEIDKYFLGNINQINKYLVKENDIVIGMDGSKVGKNVAMIKKDDENSILIQRVARIRANKKSNINYIYQHIFSDKFKRYVEDVNTSSGIPHISAQQIKDFKIGFPSLEEQQKIADFLTAIDNSIEAESNRLEELKNHKKGLMQKLFPKVN